MKPIVSVIMPSYNHERFIGYAIDSLISQTFKEWELIVIDDGSNDKSIEIISKYAAKDRRIHLFCQKNKGVSATLNRGIKLSKGKYICFLDSDDAYKKNKLEKQLELIEDGYDMVFSKIKTIDKYNNVIVDSFISKWFNDFDFNEVFNDDVKINFLKKNYICKGSVMIKRDILEKYGFFDERLITAYDYHLWLKLVGNIKIAQCGEKLKYYRWHGDNETTKNNIRMKLETILIFGEYLEKNGKSGEKNIQYVEAIYSHLKDNGVLEFFGFFQIYKKFCRKNDVISFVADNVLFEYLKNFLEKNSVDNGVRKTKVGTIGYYWKMIRKIYKERGIKSLVVKFLNKIRELSNKLTGKIFFSFKKKSISRYIEKNVEVNNKHNVLFIIPWMTVGGGDKVNLDIALNINKDKFALHFITTEMSKNEWHNRFKKITKNIFHLPDITSGDLFEFFILEYIRYAKIKTVVVSNSGKGYDCLEKIKNNFPGIKVIDILHGEGGKKENGGFPKYSSVFDKHIDRRIVISNYLKNYLINNFKIKESRISIIRNGVDIDFFDRSKFSENIYRNKYKLKKKIISFVGRLSEEKHPEKFIEIANEIVNKRKNNEFDFVMAGDGPMRDKIIKMIDKFNLTRKVEMVGAVSDVPELLKDTFLLLLTSEIEGIPIVILESMSMNVPVIATNVGGVREVIDNNVNGFLVEYGDQMTFSFSDKIIMLSDNDGLYEKMKEDSRKKIANLFDLKKAVIKYEEIFYS